MKYVRTMIAVFALSLLPWKAKAQTASVEDAFANGMWLCETPVDAVGFSSNANRAQQSGVTLTPTILGDIAKKTSCSFVESDTLKPVAVDPAYQGFMQQAFLAITDGKHSGWITSNEFVMYMAHHVVRKP